MHFQNQVLDEDDQFFCSPCGAHVRALKRLSIWRLPPILVVHLKRFAFSEAARGKLECAVNFPISGLDLEAALADGSPSRLPPDAERAAAGRPGAAPPYDLYAACCHSGTLGNGHYTALCLNHSVRRACEFLYFFVCVHPLPQLLGATAVPSSEQP